MAVQFTANGDSLANATNATVFQNALTACSVSVWINADWQGAAGTRSYVGMYNSAGGTAIQIGTKTSNGQIDVWTWGGSILVSSTGITVPSGTWVHVTYTFDGTSHRLYINGVLNNTTTQTNNPQLAGSFNMVSLNGYTSGGVSETGTFQVDTYDYYNRMLSADEVQTIYSAAGNRHGIVYGCVVRYEFDEGISGNTIGIIYNQTAYDGAVSNLISNSARTPTVTYSPGYVSGNLRPPLG
jgi:hypothetical protein